MSATKGSFEIIARSGGGGGPSLVVHATLRSREDANAFVEAFDPIQIALFPGVEIVDAGETGPEDAQGDDDPTIGDGGGEAATPREPLPGTKAGDVLEALRAGAFDHRDAAKRLGMGRYEARIIYERLVAAGHWTPAREAAA